MFDLNSNEFNTSVAVFNNRVAGKVDEVSLRVEKKESSDTSNSPDFKVFLIKDGAEMNGAFWYPNPNDEGPFSTEKRTV